MCPLSRAFRRWRRRRQARRALQEQCNVELAELRPWDW